MTSVRTLLLAGIAITATQLAPELGATGLGGRRIPMVIAQSTPAASDPTVGSTDSIRSADRDFILQALETSRTQAELARLAVSQALRSDVREFAQQLAGDYREINVTLESLARRKAVAPPVQPVSYSDQYRTLAARPGTAFDEAYIREMAAANQRALRIVEAAVSTVRDADIRAFAGSLLPMVREHSNRGTELEKTL